MFKIVSIPALCGQEIGILGNDVIAGREPRGSYLSDQFSAEVYLIPLSNWILDTGLTTVLAILITRISMLWDSPSVP